MLREKFTVQLTGTEEFISTITCQLDGPKARKAHYMDFSRLQCSPKNCSFP